MPPSRLSDVHKQEILDLYQRGQETTTSLASRYGVSNSTVIRVLKSFLPPDAYDALVQSKRSNGREKSPESAKLAPKSTGTSEPKVDAVPSTIAPVAKESTPGRQRRSRTPAQPSSPITQSEQLPLLQNLKSGEAATEHPTVFRESQTLDEPDLEHNQPAPPIISHAPRPEELAEVETELLSELRHTPQALDDDEDDDDGFEDDFEDDFEDEDEDEDDSTRNRDDFSVFENTQLEIHPLADSDLPRTCYVVIDRTAELVTRPLKDFGQLGKVPHQEAEDRILPIFDNHRIAKRFSNRNQRIIKVPDGQMFSRASIQLQAKGITRLLIDGRIYTLAASEP